MTEVNEKHEVSIGENIGSVIVSASSWTKPQALSINLQKVMLVR